MKKILVAVMLLMASGCATVHHDEPYWTPFPFKVTEINIVEVNSEAAMFGYCMTTTACARPYMNSGVCNIYTPKMTVRFGEPHTEFLKHELCHCMGYVHPDDVRAHERFSACPVDVNNALKLVKFRNTMKD